MAFQPIQRGRQAMANILGTGNTGLQPSPTRSALVEQLLAQAQNTPAQSKSFVESLNIASAPILAAILARREEKGRQNEAQSDQDIVSALLSGDTQMRSVDSLLGRSNSQLSQQIRGQMAANALTPQESPEPKITRIGQRVIPAQYLGTEKPDEREVWAETLPNGDVQQFIMQNGKRTVVEGLTTPIERIETGGPRDFDLGDAERKALNDEEVGTRNYIGTAAEAMQILQDTPDVNTFLARSASFVNDLQANVMAAATYAGLDFRENTLDPETYSDTFDELGIQNARLRGLITTLSFQRGAALKSTGQSVSNKDVERFIAETGFGVSDPRAIRQTLLDSARRSERMFMNSYKVRTGQDWDGDLGISALESMVSPSYKPPSKPITEWTDEELDEFERSGTRPQ